MKAVVIPFALSDPGLLSGLLLSACRSLAPQDRQSTAASDDYSHMALRYKYECIRTTNNAITSEGMSVKDATISVVLFMCADEVRPFLHSLLSQVPEEDADSTPPVFIRKFRNLCAPCECNNQDGHNARRDAESRSWWLSTPADIMVHLGSQFSQS